MRLRSVTVGEAVGELLVNILPIGSGGGVLHFYAYIPVSYNLSIRAGSSNLIQTLDSAIHRTKLPSRS